MVFIQEELKNDIIVFSIEQSKILYFAIEQSKILYFAIEQSKILYFAIEQSKKLFFITFLKIQNHHHHEMYQTVHLLLHTVHMEQA